MTQSSDYKRGYSRGYSRGAHWPEHKPPLPPDEIMSAFIASANKLRDRLDSWLGMFDQDDELIQAIGPFIDDFDQRAIAIGKWLKEPQATVEE